MTNRIRTMALSALTMMGAFAVFGGYVTVSGEKVTYDGAAVTTLANGDVLLTFTQGGIGTFSLPKNAKARILAIGGGGAGGALGEYATRGAGGGGGAGGMIDRNQILDPGEYTVSVGRGGQRVQTIVQAWVGDDGEYSTIRFGGENGELIVAAKGGGGGGSVKMKGRGTDGGSGGGGSWYGEFLGSGNGTDGQGNAGGFPDNEDIGGGGGGAAEVIADGRGKADGTPGAGRVCDITGGNVTYARGGRGGNRGDSGYEPKDGVTRGYGCGGDGAVTGYAGAGADGIVIVRISELFEYEMVDLPDDILPQTWVNGQTISAFDLAETSLKDAVEAVEGETNVVCALNGETREGLGQHSFVLYLKEGYKWKIGDEGSTEPLICYWRVVDPDTFEIATIEAGKTVSWADGNHATISLEAFATPEKKEHVPNVLVLGSLCSSHELTANIVKATLNSITEIGNVDYYYFNKNTDTSLFHGSLSKGQKYTGSVSVTDSNHWTANAFYNKLWDLIDNGTAAKYDYILFSFDRSRVVGEYKSANSHESAVADFLRPYYQRNAVIWLVDDEPEQCTYSVSSGYYSSKSYTITQTPWAPYELYPYTSGNSTTWRTMVQHAGSSSAGYNMFKGLLGLFDPVKYASVTQDEWNSKNIGGALNADSVDNVTRLGGARNPNQCVYDDANKVSSLIKSVIVTQPMILKLVDKVAVSIDSTGINRGLDIEDVRAEWGTNDWSHVCTDDEINIDFDSGRVEVAVGQVLDPAWLRVDIDVVDNGSFRSSVGARYNERTGLWEKDPNDGPVNTSLIPTNGTEIIVESEAKTAVKWSFSAYNITGGITEGEGEFVINGFITNEYFVAEGYSPEIVFRGKGGYVLSSLVIDDTPQQFDDTTYHHFFENIANDHDIRVGFKQVISLETAPTVSGTSYVYDGRTHGVEVTPPVFTDGYDFDWVPLYSLDPEGPFSQDLGAIDVGTTNVYVRYGILGQLGYADGEPAEYTGWTGCAPVTITKRPLEITVCDQVQVGDSQIPTSDFTYVDVNGSLAEGDSKKVTFTLAGGSVPAEGQSKTIIGAVTVKNEKGEDVSGNYDIKINDGTYTHLAQQACAATADDVVKIYDGQATSIDLNVINPDGAVDGKQTTRNNLNENMAAAADGVSIGTGNNHQMSVRASQSTGAAIKEKNTTNNKTLYGCVSNETCVLKKEIVTDHYTVEYSADGGKTWSTELPTYTDVSTNTVKYRVQYWQTKEQTVEHTVTAYGYSSSNRIGNTNYKYNFVWYNYTSYGTKYYSDSYVYTDTKTVTIPYTTYEGEAQVIIKPREVTIAAGSEDLGRYNGTTLSNNTVVISGDGFVAGQGPDLDKIRMTGDSTITEPGTVANVIDQSTVEFGPGYKPENYKITYVDGELKVGKNSITTEATAPAKTYDGKQSAAPEITILDADGNPVPGGYTIRYASNPWDEFTTDVPVPPTNAGEYSYWYVVDGGDGYGVKTNFTTITVNPITIQITAKDAQKIYDGEPLTAGAEVTAGEFIAGEGIEEIRMTADSTRTSPGKTKNKVGEIVWKDGTSAQNYNIVKVDGTLTVTRELTFEVEDDGEFSWTMNPGEGEAPGNVLVVVDGVTNLIGKVDNGHYAVHIAEPKDSDDYVTPPDMDCVQKHTVEFIFTEDDGEMFPDEVVWYPQASPEELIDSVFTLDPPVENVDEFKQRVEIYNDPYSGWLPVYGDDGEGNEVIVGIRTSDGCENTTNNEESAVLESRFQLAVNGTGEIAFGRIEIPVRNDDGTQDEANPDHGSLVITIDGVDYTIPPLVDLDEGCTVTTNDGVIVIENLILKVNGYTDKNGDIAMSATNTHYVTMTYTRDANSPSNNTAAVVSGVTWKTYGESDDGGSSWIQDKQLWIIDHDESVEQDCVYLCFRPKLNVEEEVVEWVRRSNAKQKIKVKFGDSPEAMEACTPVIATLVEDETHKVEPVKVWVSVPLSEVNSTAAYWKVYIEGDEAGDVHTGDDPVSDGDAAETENTFGVLEIVSSQTNTMISIPWTDYTYDEVTNVAPIKIAKLVKPEGFEDGDMLYAYKGDNSYYVWMLDGKEWISKPIFKVDKDGNQSLQFASGYENARASRGGALWAVRKHPCDENGNPKKIIVHGQTTEDNATSDIAGTANGKPGTTMIGNPWPTAIDVNDVDWGANPSATDFLTMPVNEGGAPVKLTWAKGVWGYTVKKLNSKGRVTSARQVGYQLQPGMAFWYTRNGEAFQVVWPKPNK